MSAVDGDLAGWRLTLPTGAPERPTIVDKLAGFTASPWFTRQRGALVFRAPVNGVTTKGSSYPRCELRGPDMDSRKGRHVLQIVGAFTKLPAKKPHVVAAQVHSGNDDVTTLRLEGSTLYVTKGDMSHFKAIRFDYELGERFTLSYVVADGQVRVYVDGKMVSRILANFSRGYFKAGAYVQANCSNSSPCSASNYGEVMLYDVRRE